MFMSTQNKNILKTRTLFGDIFFVIIAQVGDRTVVQTTDAERRTTAPEALQPAIDELVKSFPNGRSFVR